ncbi:hypothetical protein [Thioalkalivibrio sp. ALJ15]|uniref:hypothetical protein n=1 Tax=Thioalkalivibrio sp. ALJ15 TaxID=748652 RepID=UPI00037C80B9|nr:hypothetical protein [Thioalkalivibrio sp. ALJ15]
MAERGQFYAVDAETVELACDQGLHQALAYLVMAAGSGHDQITTGWSAEAVRKYTGIRWTRAKAAVDALLSAGLVSQSKGKGRPRYKLRKPTNKVWLPNTLVTGVGTEDPPLARMRRLHDTDAVRVLVRLYAANDLQEEGGIPTSVLRDQYAAERVADYGNLSIWRFDYDTSYASPSAPLEGIDRERWWPILKNIQRAGLLYCEPWLFDADHEHGEPIHPLEGDGIEGELSAFLGYISDRMPSVEHALEIADLVVPVYSSIPEPAAVGIYQLRYLPHAKHTMAGLSGRQESTREFVRMLREKTGQPHLQGVL